MACTCRLGRHLSLPHDVPLGVTRKDAVRPHRRGTAGPHIHAARQAHGVVVEDAIFEGGGASIPYQNAPVGIAPHLAALQAAPAADKIDPMRLPVIDPDLMLWMGEGMAHLSRTPYLETLEGSEKIAPWRPQAQPCLAPPHKL